MKKPVTLLSILLLAIAAYYQQRPDASALTEASAQSKALRNETRNSAVNAAVERAIEQHSSHLQLTAVGAVKKTLSDDNDGSRHQRFIVELPSGHTLLVAHNIDLAQRVPDLRQGNAIELYGEYIWNDRGGVMHWTHHDPSGRHEAGWIKYNGQTYQ